MSLITEMQLAGLRRIAYRQLTTPFTVFRPNYTDGDYGTAVEWVEIDHGLGWLRMMNKPFTTVQVGLIAEATAIYRLHTSVDVQIHDGDRVFMQNQYYEVQDANEDDTVQVYRTLLMRRLQ